MTDPQRRAVEVLADCLFQNGLPLDEEWQEIADTHHGWNALRANGILTALREANLVILDRETVAAAVAVAKSFTSRWTEYECFTQMQDALGGREGAMGESDN